MNIKKINWLSILQGWAMFWVVVGHSPLSMDETIPAYVKFLYEFAYSFHMPLFILVSGFLFQMTRLNHYAKDTIATAWGQNGHGAQ